MDNDTVEFLLNITEFDALNQCEHLRMVEDRGHLLCLDCNFNWDHAAETSDWTMDRVPSYRP